ncbi:MAG: hypothetical protein VX541_00845 [Candidatus Poribacteria bacterium]|nr:hypothetical protein [Candidatus Poribacteria bacterium]
MKRVHSCPHRILIAIRFLIPFFCIFLLFSSFVTWCFGDSEFQSIILLIDTSKSMDMTDTRQLRWTSVKVLINRLQIDQWICVMGFTDSVLPIIEPTRIGGNIEQKANLERKLSIPINGKEKKDGILGQALFQAEKTFQSMPSSKPQALILMTDSKAEFTRKQWNQFLKNSSGRKSFVLTNHQDKSISVSNGQKRPHSNLLTAFLYAVNDIDGYQFYEQKKILSKQHIFLHDPKIENLEFQFTSSQKRKSEIKIEDSQGNRIFPYFKTSHCASYWIPQPALGFWQVSLGNHNQVELLAFKKEKPNMSIGHLEFESPPLSYEPGREIDLQIRLAEGKYSFNQIYGKALWGEVEEKIIFHQTVDQSLYIAKYAPKETGTHKFITDPSQDYIINPPIRTVELEMYQFPVWITVSIMSGGIGIGGIVLLLFIFLRKRPTRNESEDGETEDKIEIDPRAEIAELHNIIVKQKISGVSTQQEEQQESIPDAVENQQDTEDSNTPSIDEQIPAIHAQEESTTLPIESEDIKPTDSDLNQEFDNDSASGDLASESSPLKLEDFDNIIKPNIEEATPDSEEISSGFDSENEVSEETEEIKDTSTSESNQDNVLPNQQTKNGENQNPDNVEPDIVEDTSNNLDMVIENPVPEDEPLDIVSEVHSDNDITSQNEETIEARNDTFEPVQIETTNQQIDELKQQPEGEGIDWYIGKFLSNIQNIVAADNMEVGGVAAETASRVPEEEDLIQVVDEKQVEELDQENDVNQRIDKILTEIEVLSKE